jgi:prevent-host-death family protein
MVDVENILSEVRSRLLDFALELRDVVGIDVPEKELAKKAASVDTEKLFNTAVYQTLYGLGSADHKSGGSPLRLTSHQTSLTLRRMNRKNWPVQDAKARFSELLDACVNEGPQIVTRRGQETAVLVSREEWERLLAAARPTLKALLLTHYARAELPLPARGRGRRRPPPPL